MISVINLEKQYGAKVLYREASLAVHKGKRYGLIGHNGAGKSVFLRMVAGEESPTGGVVQAGSGMNIGYLPQEAEEQDGNLTPLEIIKEPFLHLLEAQHHFEEIASLDHESEEYKRSLEKLSLLQSEMEKHEIYSLHSRACSILTGLGLSQESLEQPLKELSGGYRMRVLLGKLLLQNPDFLLLDEPTNHLDMDSLIWVERFLTRFSGGMLIVSHDRDFLNRVITDTVEVSGGKLKSFSGNLTRYFEWKAMNEESEVKRVKNLTDKIEQTERFVERFKAKATKATQAQSRMKALEKLKEELPEEEQQRRSFHFKLPPATPCGAVPLRFEDLNTGYDSKQVLFDVNCTISKGEKVAIIGPNGAGKSTFLKCCAGLLDPWSGKRVVGHNADIRLFSQHRMDSLNGESTLYDTVVEVLGENRPTEVRSLLGSFLFSGEEVLKPVKVLSGGEKSRLSLLLMLARPGNTILLDEPTNHLDMESIEEVGKALREYDGTVIMVSHDEYFINLIAERIIEVRPGSFRDFPGKIEDYRSYIEKGFINSETSDVRSTSTEKSEKSESSQKESRIAQREERKKLTRMVEKAEREIADLEEKTQLLKEKLNDPDNAQNFDLLIDIQNEIDTLSPPLESAMNRWEELTMALEEIQ